jgi:hypothetical protein
VRSAVRSSSAEMDGSQRPVARGPGFGSGGSGAQAGSAACWLAPGPRAHAGVWRTAVGCILSRAEKERLCTVCFVNCFDIFTSIYV